MVSIPVSDQRIGKVAAPVAIELKRREGEIEIFDLQYRDPQHTVENIRDFAAGEAIDALKHPDDFAEDHVVDEARLVLRASLFDEPRRALGLLGIVLDDVSDQDIGIEADHRPLIISPLIIAR